MSVLIVKLPSPCDGNRVNAVGDYSYVQTRDGQTPENHGTAAAAMLPSAGLAVGFWRDEAELTSLWHAERRFDPGMPAEQRATLLGGWRRAVERCRHWIPAE